MGPRCAGLTSRVLQLMASSMDVLLVCQTWRRASDQVGGAHSSRGTWPLRSRPSSSQRGHEASRPWATWSPVRSLGAGPRGTTPRQTRQTRGFHADSLQWLEAFRQAAAQAEAEFEQAVSERGHGGRPAQLFRRGHLKTGARLYAIYKKSLKIFSIPDSAACPPKPPQARQPMRILIAEH
jgi:hypothetical protein